MSSSSKSLLSDAAERIVGSSDRQASLLAAAVPVVTCLTLVATFILLTTKNKSTRKKNKKLEKDDDDRSLSSYPYPPGPKGHWLFGNLFDGQPDFANGETYDTKNLEGAIEHGLVFSVTLPFVLGRLIVVSDPVLAKRILVTKNYPKPSLFYSLLTPLVGEQSLVLLSGNEWASMRRSFNPGFAPLFLQTMVATMTSKLERFVGKIEKDIATAGKATNMLLEAQSFTSDVIVTLAFGEDWGNSEEPHPARRLENEICTLYSKLSKAPLRRLLDFPTKRRMKKVGEELDAEMRAILERRLQQNSTADNARDILSLAIAHMAKDSNKNGSGGDAGAELTEEDKCSIVDQLKTFYFAGHDTTATTIAWAIWELSKHPEALERLRKELQEHGVWTSTSGESFDATPPTYEQLQKCVYLDGIVKESLRLYPPASGLSRKCENDFETYNGWRIGGAILIVNAYAMHRHPDLWKRPNEFLPERFSDGSEGDDINAKFMPFSKGKRDCIGKYFALLEAKLAISSLAMRYDMKCDDPTDHMEQVLTNLPARGAKVKFSQRATK